MDNQILLTYMYRDNNKIYTSFDWYEDEEELDMDMRSKKEGLEDFQIIEIWRIAHAETIEQYNITDEYEDTYCVFCDSTDCMC